MLNRHELNGVTVAINSIVDSNCSIVVFEFPYQNDCGNSEWEIQQMEYDNTATEEFRIKMFCAGWWWSIELPYESLPDGGIFVKYHLELEEETTFEHPWDYPKNGYDQSPTARESFYPAIPSYTPNYNYKMFISDDGFVEDSFLMWHLDYDN